MAQCLHIRELTNYSKITSAMKPKHKVGVRAVQSRRQQVVRLGDLVGAKGHGWSKRHLG